MLRALFLRRRILATAVTASLLIAALVAFANHRVLTRHTSALFTDIATTPTRDFALVLGTSPTTSSGRPNLHFTYRIEAAAALFHAGKVRHILVSGDNHRPEYDEPTQMKKALMAHGVPRTAITCDYAGFRTLDSIVRAREVFNLHSCTIVTQRYHNSRALEIAQARGLDAIGFCTRDVPTFHSVRTELREIGARTVTVLDLYVWNRQPHFRGPYAPILLAQN